MTKNIENPYIEGMHNHAGVITDFSKILQVRNRQLTEVLGYLQIFIDDYHAVSEGSKNYRSLVIAYSCLFEELVEELSLSERGQSNEFE